MQAAFSSSEILEPVALLSCGLWSRGGVGRVGLWAWCQGWLVGLLACWLARQLEDKSQERVASGWEAGSDAVTRWGGRASGCVLAGGWRRADSGQRTGA